MGDRANFVFEQSNGDRIFLYGHWAGDGMMPTLAHALDVSRNRWQDEAYGTRITISNIIGDEWTQETGWGISTYITDNEHSVPVVNWSKGNVTLYNETLTDIKFTMSLDAFVKKFSKVKAGV